MKYPKGEDHTGIWRDPLDWLIREIEHLQSHIRADGKSPVVNQNGAEVDPTWINTYLDKAIAEARYQQTFKK